MTPLQLTVTDSAPLSAATLRRLGRLLLEERRATLERVAAFVDSDAGMTVERELASVLVAQARQAVDEIDGAVARMDAGTYGWCEACGERLSIARLEAIPHARSCVACQAGGDTAP